MTTTTTRLIGADAVLAEQLEDPEFRAYWERTALARAVALRLVRYRSEHNLSQGALARRLGMQQPAISRLETGEHTPRLDTLVRLSEALGVEFRLDIRPSARPATDHAAIVEEIPTPHGGRLLVTTT